MNTDKRVLRIGTAVIACAAVLRLLSGSAVGAAVRAVDGTALSQAVLLLQTGRVVRLEEPVSLAQQPEPEETQVPEEPEDAAVFTAADAVLVDIHSYCSYSVDTAELLTQKLSWDLTGPGPTVLILHTHGTEGYTDSAGYRSSDTSRNVVSVGRRIAELLTAGGIGVIHDETMHDSASYSDSYVNARAAIEQYLEEYPSIRLVLDIHRDAAEDSSGSQICYTVETDRGTAAKLMLVVGTDASGRSHPNWAENMALAVKLHAQLEKLQPDICRSISFREARFNQDLSAGALLIEVGAAGNTQQQALLAAELLTEAIQALSTGAN